MTLFSSAQSIRQVGDLFLLALLADKLPLLGSCHRLGGLRLSVRAHPAENPIQ